MLLFLLLCFLLFITYVILFFLPFFPASLHVSRLIVLAVVVLVIIPPLSQLVFLLLPSPPRACEQENNGLKNKSFCLPIGDPCENVISQNHCFFSSVVDFFHPQNMCLFHVLGLSFEGVRDSLLLHICFCFLGVWHTTFFRSNLSLLPALFGFVVFFLGVFPFLGVSSACLVFFVMGSALFPCQCSSSSWDSLSLIVLS